MTAAEQMARFIVEREWTVRCTRHHLNPCQNCLRDSIEKALADARAAGFAEAIEMAAKVCSDEERGSATTNERLVCRDIEAQIRALAPAATNEEP